ncbi:MAG: hypothetical protein K5655_03585 [Lachnospiraceae bacterium]|nr:hypothetical protein [Lachnospiraceae bacterium]
METKDLTYISILIDSLKKKIEILERLKDDTTKQEELLSREELDFDAFNKTIESKDKSLARLNELDNGFLEVYEKVAPVLKKDKESFENEITYMKELVRRVTDYSTTLTALEERNKVKLSIHLNRGKQKIKDYKQSSKTVAAYYKNIANKRTPEGSTFYDKKK